MPQSHISPIHSSKSNELPHQPSPELSNRIFHTTTGPAPNTSCSSRSSGDEHQHSPPSQPVIRLTVDSGNHFLHATRSTSPGVATKKERLPPRSETSKSPSQPVAFPSRIRSSEREDSPSPSKLKASSAMRYRNLF